jgi:hypothetical protein
MDIDHPAIETNPQQSSSSSSQNLGGDSEEGAETKNPSNVSPRGLQRKLTKERRKLKEFFFLSRRFIYIKLRILTRIDDLKGGRKMRLPFENIYLSL